MSQEGEPFIIYALVCPLTLEVKYVGQTTDLEQRTRGSSHKMTQNTPVCQWLRTLGYLKPYKVILERGINRRVTVKATARDSVRGRRPIGERPLWLSTAMETKWIKRLRRTLLNRKVGSIDINRLLVNSPEQHLGWQGPTI